MVFSLFHLHTVATACSFAAYLFAGISLFQRLQSHIRRGKIFDENLLIALATLGAMGLGEFAESALVMSLHQLGEYLEGLATAKSHLSVRSLLHNMPEVAHVKRGNTFLDLDPQEVKEGEMLLIKPGERIPLDGKVIGGISTLDVSSITGESQPLPIHKGDFVWSGTINREGTILIETTTDYHHSTSQRIAQFLFTALQKRTPTERFITTFARYYTPLVLILAAGVFLFPLLREGRLSSSALYQALILLMISCPCALVISIPLGFLMGIGRMAREGILVKGSQPLEALSLIGTVAFDKTGTLTEGKFRVKEVFPFNGYPREKILELAAIAGSCSRHPLAQAIAKHHHMKPSPDAVTCGEIPGMGVITHIHDLKIVLGRKELLERVGIPTPADLPETGVHVGCNGAYWGFILLEDTPKSEVKETINALHSMGIEIYLLSGDQENIVGQVAQELGIKKFFARLMPDEKVGILETLKKEKKGGTIAFVGDGINDAPALAFADVGMAMGEQGIGAALESAKVILAHPSFAKIKVAITLARHIRRIIWQNIGLSIGAKVVFLLLTFQGEMSLWEAVFADVGIMVLVLFNTLRILRHKDEKDQTTPIRTV